MDMTYDILRDLIFEHRTAVAVLAIYFLMRILIYVFAVMKR